MIRSTSMSASCAAMACLLAAPLAGRSHAAILHADKDTLLKVVKSAHPGDVVRLAGGTYPVTVLTGLTFEAPGVTLRPADPANPPVFAELTVGSSQGLRLSGLEINYVGDSFGLIVAVSSHVYADELNIHGPAGSYSGNGVMFRATKDVSITNSEVHDVGTGINHIDNDGVLISGNIVHAIRSDGIRGGGSSHLEISRNLLYDFNPKPGDHPDAIQFWGTRNTPNAGPIVIRDNVVVRRAGQPPQSQGIFGGGAHDVTISGNLVLGAMYNGIAIADVRSAKVTGNYVQGFRDMWSGIVVRHAQDVEVRDNFANSVNLGAPAPEDVVQANNATVEQVDRADERALGKWRGAQSDRHSAGGRR